MAGILKSEMNSATIYDEDVEIQLAQEVTDVGVEDAWSMVKFNFMLCIFFILLYEVVSRVFPSVYMARRRHLGPENGNHRLPLAFALPKTPLPLAWVMPIVNLSWDRTLECAGLDAYMFLRYIRMCANITLVSGFWGMVILWPVFVTGGREKVGIYKYSMADVLPGNWRIWIPTLFCWNLTLYVLYLMNEEYKHYVERRMEFLSRGDSDILQEHHYSIMVENIPHQLRSDTALYEYFESLFPSKVHAAYLVLNIPDLESLEAKQHRIIKRLEKAITHHEVLGDVRPTHIVGSKRIVCFDVEIEPLNCLGGRIKQPERPVNDDYEEMFQMNPAKRGERVDSISYYRDQLRIVGHEIGNLRAEKMCLAESGDASESASAWLERAVRHGLDAAASTLGGSRREEEYLVLGLRDNNNTKIGTLCTSLLNFFLSGFLFLRRHFDVVVDKVTGSPFSSTGFVTFNDLASVTCAASAPLSHVSDVFSVELAPEPRDIIWEKAGQDMVFSYGRKWTANCLLVIGAILWSIPLTAIQAIASVESLAKIRGLQWVDALLGIVFSVELAPEPRDIIWGKAGQDMVFSYGRKWTANFLLVIGAILWSIPLTAIQAIASVESLSKIRGLQWVDDIVGDYQILLDSYLPVLSLLGLIMLLPIVFEWVATNYEERKTHSDVQKSVMTRYFYFQLANIYVTVTAGSILDSLADILDHPTNALAIFGQSFPTVVGYFVTFIVTKTFAGLPIVLLRVAPLIRALFMKVFFSEQTLTQRELDQIYKKRNLHYGWEYPNQLLVIVICFTYSCISPVILPVGAVFFIASLLVYKYQVLFVYTPIYESGGIMFPSACNRTLVGLICGQVTLLGYTLIVQGYYQPLALLPLPMITLKMIDSFKKSYEDPSKHLSFERAMKLDRNATAHVDFSKTGYRQPVLLTGQAEPEPYRRQPPEAKIMSGNDTFTGNLSPSTSDDNAFSFVSSKDSSSRKLA
eukprot:CAMPEP_0194448308 /NCGR_PEP_ID=MMETSP0176-20130528/129494_1 /TAXON_ID=216777 /ORGANISM="Proboscia alata, Strain PI-D3" /LENGTH=971 /DNA_ID=CAMNT_0039275269 /DNA_START=42 /DNA_END=2958 /DNA_ORIENTATION=+